MSQIAPETRITGIHIPNFITRTFIRTHKNTHNFIYGDSLDWAGDGKQAQEARGEVNAFMVPVKYRKCYNDDTAFLTDKMFDENVRLFLSAMSKVPVTLPIIVFPKIGCGYNQMPTRCPKSYRALISILKGCPLVINKETI